MKRASLDELKGKIKGILENRGEFVLPEISKPLAADKFNFSMRREA